MFRSDWFIYIVIYLSIYIINLVLYHGSMHIDACKYVIFLQKYQMQGRLGNTLCINGAKYELWTTGQKSRNKEVNKCHLVNFRVLERCL